MKIIEKHIRWFLILQQNKCISIKMITQNLPMVGAYSDDYSDDGCGLMVPALTILLSSLNSSVAVSNCSSSRSRVKRNFLWLFGFLYMYAFSSYFRPEFFLAPGVYTMDVYLSWGSSLIIWSVFDSSGSFWSLAVVYIAVLNNNLLSCSAPP